MPKFILSDSNNPTIEVKLIIHSDGSLELVDEKGDYYLICIEPNGNVIVNENPRFGLKYLKSIK